MRPAYCMCIKLTWRPDLYSLSALSPTRCCQHEQVRVHISMLPNFSIVLSSLLALGIYRKL